MATISPEIADSQTRLLTGIQKFRDEIYPDRRGAYKQVVEEGQKPHALVITCADSRIDPEALTQSGPGEIFVLRNIGNLVPAYGEMVGGVSAVIEYAVAALNVSQIVVCGHSDCGAMKGLLHPEKVAKMPIVKSWLRNGEAALQVMEAKTSSTDEAQLLTELIEENVLLQMNHLRTHPSVAGRVAGGALGICGWVYDIEHGMVRIYDETAGRFIPFDQMPVPGRRAGGANG